KFREANSVENYMSSSFFQKYCGAIQLAIGLAFCGAAWFINPYVSRETAHFVGVFGFPLVVSFFSQMFYEHASNVKYYIVTLVLYMMAPLVLGKDNLESLPAIVYLTPCIAVFALVYISSHKKLILKNNSQKLAFCAGFAIAPSIGWELIIQPWFDVYGNGPRGYIQWEQFIVDYISVQISIFFMWLFTLRSK
ncbi:hypothetical protein ACS1UC_004758, partial [Vibrio parahaemolyticus]